MTKALVTLHRGLGNGKKLQELKPEDKVKVLDDVLKVSDYLIELIEK